MYVVCFTVNTSNDSCSFVPVLISNIKIKHRPFTVRVFYFMIQFKKVRGSLLKRQRFFTRLIFVFRRPFLFLVCDIFYCVKNIVNDIGIDSSNGNVTQNKHILRKKKRIAAETQIKKDGMYIFFSSIIDDCRVF